MNTGTLEALEGTTFDAASLLELGVIHKLGDGLKVLASGDLTRAITVTATLFSAAAAEKIKAAGGTVNVIEPKIRVSNRKK